MELTRKEFLKKAGFGLLGAGIIALTKDPFLSYAGVSDNLVGKEAASETINDIRDASRKVYTYIVTLPAITDESAWTNDGVYGVFDFDKGWSVEGNGDVKRASYGGDKKIFDTEMYNIEVSISYDTIPENELKDYTKFIQKLDIMGYANGNKIIAKAIDKCKTNAYASKELKFVIVATSKSIITD